MFIVLLVTAVAASAADIRTFGGKSVDLQPVHDSKIDKKGERPLEHCKAVLFITVLDQPDGWDRCRVEIEGKQDHAMGDSVEVFLRPCP
jgi:hypothetical protein